MLSSGSKRTLIRDLAIVASLLIATEVVLRIDAPIYGQQLFDNEYTGSLAASVEELARRVEAQGGTLIVTYIAPRFLLSSDPSDNPKNVPVERFSIDPLKRVEQVAKRIGIRYVDSREALSAARQRILAEERRRAPMYIFFDYAHMDDNGHRAIAVALAAAARSLTVATR